MLKRTCVISYDIGTTGVKTCIFEIGKTIELLAGASKGYNLYVLPDGGAEQNPDEWWAAMCDTTHEVLASAELDPSDVDGISFCSQMQGFVAVDREGKPVRRAMSYMDQRASEQLKKGMAHGPQIAGANVPKLLKSLQITGAVAASVKDPVWKYKWVEDNEPENFRRMHKWLDVKESIICRMTGEFIMTRDSAFATLLYDIRKGREGWSKPICDMLGVKPEHLAEIKECTDKVGELTQQAADELGLYKGTAVFGGGGDASLIGVAMGAVKSGDTHVYWGTSGWVSTVVDKSVVDTSAMIAAIVGAEQGKFNYFAELETAGKCLEWARDRIALDELGVYINPATVDSVYNYMTNIASKVPAGSGGVVFAPWLHGNRCPFEDPNARGMFFNLSLETTEAELIRAVIEGVVYHLRWFLETENKKVAVSEILRFGGGGALSDLICEILADCTGHVVETVKSPQNVGAVGAAVLAAVGLSIVPSVGEAKTLIPADKTYRPNPENKKVYDKYFEIYKKLYASNKQLFAECNK